MKQYVIKRKEVCAGQLVRRKKERTGVSPASESICRGMLFQVEEPGLANDLIYTTPTKYQIEGREINQNEEREFVIQHYVELEELLSYLQYGIDLTQKDLDQIFKRIVLHKWWLMHHLELFGWEKVYDGKTGLFLGYENSGTQTLPKNIYDQLDWIHCSKTGCPNPEEPNAFLIKKRK